MIKKLILIFVCFELNAIEWKEIQSSKEIDSIINFMASPIEEVGCSFVGTAGKLKNLTLPLSYYNSPEYWGEYVCKLPKADCTVVDKFNQNDYTLTPLNTSPGGNLQVERVNVNYGANIYDAACWQIAMAVAGKAGKKSPTGQSLYSLANNVDESLAQGYSGNAGHVQLHANRAITKNDGTFTYNGTKITNPLNAYSYRMVTRNWLSKDPFMGTNYAKYIKAEDLPKNNPDYKEGLVTWMDWKPITGENAWAFLIGPMQAAYLEHIVTGKKKFIPYKSVGIQNAIKVLEAFKAMQAPIGAIYYATSGSLGNVGDTPVNSYEVSVENNASALAGLLMMDQVLDHVESSEEGKKEISQAQNIIKSMIYGDSKTKGLLSFFKNYAWDKEAGIFLQGGIANSPKEKSDWVPTTEPKAVDVSTWGATVLGQPLLDSWFGFGTAYKIWTNTKKWGGFYGPDGELWGVGYSNQDGNGQNSKGIISAEWTAGAINMIRALITQYSKIKESDTATKEQKQFVEDAISDLQKDHDSMMKNIVSLRNDKYETNDAYKDVRPANYGKLINIPDNKLSFIYASKRYFIPFGWFANPIPSTTSTAWIIMLNYGFNPFTLGGGYEANFPADK